MSGLDRAFIKAFARCESSDPLPPPHVPFGPSARRAPETVAARQAQALVAAPAKSPATPAPAVPVSPAPVRLYMPLKPELEVAQFPWPKVCDSLLRAAGDGLEQLADRMSNPAPGLPKTWAITSGQRGVGRSTLLFAVARLLARRGIEVVMVDADFAQPGLAERLKLKPEAGWEAAISRGTSLEELLIESTDDHIALLPLLEPGREPHSVAEVERLRDGLARLTRHYDAVLVRAEPLGGRQITAGFAAIADRVDAAILVHDARGADGGGRSMASERLKALGIGLFAEVENFATDRPPQDT